MRIAHVVATFPPRVGGMGKVAYDECMELTKRGHDVTVFTMWYPDDREYPALPVPFKVVRLVPHIHMGDAGWVPELKRSLAGFDIIHLHYPWYGGAEFVLKAKRKYNQKYVVTYHMDARPVGILKRSVKMVYDALYAKSILHNAEKILTVDKNYFERSPVEAHNFVPLHSKMVELPNGVDTELFHPNGEGVDCNQPLQRELLFVGNLMPVKGLDVLLNALAVMVGANARSPLPVNVSDIHLTVVGSGYNELQYKKMVSDLGLQNHVTFVGSVPPNEIPPYYRKAWSTIVPSRAESFSLVALESLACGTPVIVSDIPGARSRVIDGSDGYLFTPDSVDSLVEKINTMMHLSDEERKAMGERGVHKVRESYSLEKHVAVLESVYSHVV